jgi:5-methylcytosine-specific restriction endonuclease McrBC regulatory subunit McrC
MSRGDIIALEAGPSVGAIPLLNGDVLWIVPRAGQNTFSRMLIVSEGLDDAIKDEIDGEATLSSDAGPVSLESALARPFLARLRGIEKLSLDSGRQKIYERRSSARGRIEPLSTTLDLAKRTSRPVHCSYHRRTFDTPEHRVLGAAAMRLFSLGAVPGELQATAYRWGSFVAVRRLAIGDLRHVVAGLSRGSYSGFRAYYIPALTLARLILSHASLGFGAGNLVPTQTILTNVPLLFERYVRRLIASELSLHGIVVEKIEGGARARRLFMDGSGDLLPDILVSKQGRTVLVADAKYKPGRSIDADNYYQLRTYLRAYNCNKGMLVLPCSSSETVSSAVRRVFWDGMELHEVRLALENTAESENFLLEYVRRELL